VEPEWYWAEDADPAEPDALTSVEYLTLLLQDPDSAVLGYSDAQIGQGLWYLVCESSSGYMATLIEPEVSWVKRRACIREFPTFFARLFASRCTEHLSHFDAAGANPLNSACYMWWDIFCHWGNPTAAAYAELDAELLTVLKQILLLDSMACQESALHGLGHWQANYPKEVREIIDDYLARRLNLPPILQSYACNARIGHVQ
jgi:hypothetical protein